MKPKIFVFDIETSKFDVSVFALRQPGGYIPHSAAKNEPFMFGWSGKYLWDDEIISSYVTPSEAKQRNDKRVAENLWHRLEEADVVIAHNGANFDIRWANYRFWKHGMQPPASYQVIDTKKAAQKVFRLPSYSLDYIATMVLGIQGKIQTEPRLWDRCEAGEPAALQAMQLYNDQDVIVLEDVYEAMKAWIRPHPNLSFFIDKADPHCGTCMSGDLKPLGKKYRTYINEYDMYRCGNCGTLMADRLNSTPQHIKDVIKKNVPR